MLHHCTWATRRVYAWMLQHVCQRDAWHLAGNSCLSLCLSACVNYAWAWLGWDLHALVRKTSTHHSIESHWANRGYCVFIGHWLLFLDVTMGERLAANQGDEGDNTHEPLWISRKTNSLHPLCFWPGCTSAEIIHISLVFLIIDGV